MLFAEESTDGKVALLTVVGTLIGGAAVWIWNVRGQSRKTTITEWMAIADAKDARANALDAKLTEVQAVQNPKLPKPGVRARSVCSRPKCATGRISSDGSRRRWAICLLALPRRPRSLPT